MTEVAELVARMRVDATGVVTGTAAADRALAQTEKQALGLGKTLSALSKGMGEFGIPFAGAVARMESTVAGSSSRMGAGLHGLHAAAVKAGTGITLAFVAAGAEAIHLADQFEASHAQLETSLKNLGTSADEQKSKINSTDASMESLGFTYAQTEHSLSRLVVATGNMAEAQRATGLAADIARAKNMDLASATELLVKVEAGHYTLLGRQLGLSKEVISTFHNSGDAVAYLASKMGGQAAAYAETFAGKLQITKARAEDLGVQLGQAIIPSVERVADDFITVTHALGSANDALGGWLGRLALVSAVGLVAMAGVTRVAATVTSFGNLLKGAGRAAPIAAEASTGVAEGAGAAATQLQTRAFEAQAIAAAESEAAVNGAAAAEWTLSGFLMKANAELAANAAAFEAAGAAAATSGTELETVGAAGAFSIPVLGWVAAGIAAVAGVMYLASRRSHAYADDVKNLTEEIKTFGNASAQQHALDIGDIVTHLRTATEALREFKAEFRQMPAVPSALGLPGEDPKLTAAQLQGNLKGGQAFDKQRDAVNALRDSIEKAIKAEGALAVAPYFKEVLHQIELIPGAGKAVGHSFDEIKHEIAAAYAEIAANAKIGADAVGVSAQTYQHFVDMLPDGVQLSTATEQAWVRAAYAATNLGLSAVAAAKDIVDGMNAATIGVIIFADSLQQAANQQVQMDQLSESVDSLSTSMGGHGLGGAASGGGAAVKTAGQQMVDAWGKANALYDAIIALSDAYENVGKAVLDANRAVEDMGVADRNVTRAIEDHQTAIDNAAAAQKHYNEIMHGYAAGSQEAHDATRNHREALARLQQSQLAVIQAQRNLTDVQHTAGHTTADVQNAQMALTQAQNDLMDAQDNYNQSTKDLDTTLHGHAASSQEAKDATDQLRQANRSVQDSAVAVRDAVRAQQDAYIRVADTSKDVARKQHDVATAQQDVTRATLDMNGALTPATHAMGGLATNAGHAKTQLHQVEANVLSMANTIANNTADKKKNPALWAKTFLDALTVLQNFLHPSGALAQFFDQMIQKAMVLVATLQGANAATKPVPLPGGGVHIPGGPNLTARGTIAYSAQSRIFGEAGPEAAIPLGAGALARADRQRIMAQAVQIAPDLAGYGAIGGIGPSMSGGDGSGTYINIEEIHNHFIRNDRDLLDRIAGLEGATGRGITVNR